MSITGSPSAVEAAATTLTGAGRDFTHVADAIASHARAVHSDWAGTAADAAFDAITALSNRVRIGADVCAAADPVLRAYATKLRAAQQAWETASAAADAAAAAAHAAQADQATAAAMTTTTPAQAQARTTAQATATRAAADAHDALSAAHTAMGDAVARAQRADTTAATAIDALTEQLSDMTRTAPAPAPAPHPPAAPSSHHSSHWWEDAWDATKDAVEHAGQDVKDTAQWDWAQAQSVLDFYAEHPDAAAKAVIDAAIITAGAYAMAAGGTTFIGGALATATGPGALAGVPAMAVGALELGAGVYAGVRGVEGAQEDLQALQEGRVQPDPVDDMSRMDRSLADRMSDPGWKARPGNPDGSAPTTPAGGRPYDPDVANRVPEWGPQDARTRGTLVTEEGGQQVTHDVVSGRKDVVQDIPKPRPGMNGNTMDHAEAEAAAIMRRDGVKEGTLYLNRSPCSTARGGGCEQLLPRQVPTGSTLTVYGPSGYARVVIGEG